MQGVKHMPRALRFGFACVLVVVGALVVRTKAAVDSDDAALASRARKGKIRTALRVAEFSDARKDAAALRAQAPGDAEAVALYGDALWASGLFDEADSEY